MPIYEYRCPHGHTFEVFQRMSDDPIETCETCGEGPVEKVLYPVAVHFKGSGFYTTDYGKGKQKAAAGKESEAGSGGSSAESGGSKEGGSKEGGSKEGGSKEGGSKDKKPSSGD